MYAQVLSGVLLIREGGMCRGLYFLKGTTLGRSDANRLLIRRSTTLSLSSEANTLRQCSFNLLVPFFHLPPFSLLFFFFLSFTFF